MKNYSDFGHVLSFKIENDSENSSGVKSWYLSILGAKIQKKVTPLEFPKIPLTSIWLWTSTYLQNSTIKIDFQ